MHSRYDRQKQHSKVSSCLEVMQVCVCVVDGNSAANDSV